MNTHDLTTIAIMALYMFVLYYALIPNGSGGPLLDLSYNVNSKDKQAVNITHGAIFVAVYMLTHKYVLKMAMNNSM